MPTIRLQGGLGNQLFQYALGVYFEEVAGYDVRFDTRFYYNRITDDTTPRNIEINIFDIPQLKETTQETALSNGFLPKLIRMIERKLLPYYRHSYVREKSPIFDANVLAARKHSYLDGFWQSHLYHASVEQELRRRLIFKESLTPAAENIFQKIKNSNAAVSIHVRRGDYVEKYKHIFNVLDSDYYLSAINRIKQELRNSKLDLFVFSEDQEWCKKNLLFEDNTVFVDSAEMKSYEDMILMSNCQHHIIANSSYSWWGAWLNPSDTKKVISPKKWFAQNNEMFSASVYPVSWIVI